MEYYRLRSFSITSQGITNLGDSMRSRRSRSINSVTSGGSGGKDRKGSSGSQQPDAQPMGETGGSENSRGSPSYKVAMLGAAGVGKTALTYQFTTSEYICAYDLSLDDDYGQKTVSLLVNGQETDLEIIDHPACEMSEEAFCSTYHIDIFVVVYSVVQLVTLKKAEKILLYLKDNDMLLTRGAILVGNKTDLERQREVSTQTGLKVAKEIGVKFIEISSGMDFHVDELLVGIVAQVKLNPQRISRLTDEQRNSIAVSVLPQRKSPIKGRKTAISMRELPGRDATSRFRRMTRRSSIGKYGSEDEDEFEQNDKRLRRKPLDYDDEEDDDESDDERSTDNETNLLRRKRYDQFSLTALQSINPNGRQGISYKKRLSFENQLKQQQYSPETGTPDYDPNEYEGACASSSRSPTVKKLTTGGERSGPSSSSPSRSSNKFAIRTKMLLTTLLKFRRSLRVKRESSDSCSNLLVI